MQNPSKKFNKDLEGLRGFAAIGVMLVHGLGLNLLDAEYKGQGLIPYFSVGKLAVLLFFVLSGYVITSSTNFDITFNTKEYLLKRLIRLYPIYLFSFILIAIFLGFTFKPIGTLYNILFLQNDHAYFGLHCPVEVKNGPSWSLNYEVLYYLLFPLIVINIKKLKWLLYSLVFFFAISLFNQFPLFVSDYIDGYFFWLSGLIICYKLKDKQYTNVSFISYMALIVSFNHFGLGQVILKGIFKNYQLESIIGVANIITLPLCILVISDVAQKELPFRKYFVYYSYTLPLLLITYLLITKRLLADDRWIASGIFYVVSIVTFFEKKYSSVLLSKLQLVGSFSYAIYILHFPVALIIKKFMPIHGSQLGFWIKFIIWSMTVFSLSYFLERIIQPKIKQLFLSHHSN